MLSFIKKIFQHKIILVILLVAMGLAGYFGYKALANKNQSTKYFLTQVKKSDLSVTISGSGQISAVSQVTLQPQASGNLIYFGVQNGQKVKSGTLIAEVDPTNAQQAVKDAEINLETAKLSLEQAQTSTVVDETTLKRQAISYINIALNNTKNVINSFQDVFFTDTTNYKVNSPYLINYYAHIVHFYAPSDISYDTVLTDDFNVIKSQNNTNQSLFSNLSQTSNLDEIENVLNQIIVTTKTLDDGLHLGYQLLNRYQSILSDNNLTPDLNIRNITTDISTLSGYVTLVDTNLSNLLSTQKSIDTFRTSPSDTTPYNIRNLKLAVDQKQNALDDAKTQLQNYYVYAPFDGEIGSVNVSKGDKVSVGTSLAVLITNQKIAEITLNEIDAAKVQVGDAATLTFDALPDLTLKGKVSQIDPVGVQSQGVVNYNFQITFDQSDERLKPGMTVNADIVTETKSGVLVVPNAAIKTQGNRSYVQIVDPQELPGNFNLKTSLTLKTPPKNQFIEIGTSNDQNTEIISGLNEGDYVVLRTITSVTNTANTTTNTTRNMFNANFGGTQRLTR
ncbi:MAG: efflux RND transporter periplasmic adaptor subunit [Minisyncoccia bacterium]